MPPGEMCPGQIERSRYGQLDRFGEEFPGRQIERPGSLYQLARNGERDLGMSFPLESIRAPTPRSLASSSSAWSSAAAIIRSSGSAQTSRRCETQAPLGGKPPTSATVSVP